MNKVQTIGNGILEIRKSIEVDSVTKVFESLKNLSNYKFILESKDISHIYGRLSLIGFDPVLKISGKGDDFEIKVLNQRGEKFFHQLVDLDFGSDVEISGDQIIGRIEKEEVVLDERMRSKRRNSAQVIRMILETLKVEEDAMLGLYGAFSYDFIRLFEDLETKLEANEIPDFNLYLYDSFVYFDLLKEQTEIVLYRENTQTAENELIKIEGLIDTENDQNSAGFEIDNADFGFAKEDYENLVKVAKKYTQEGEIFEVVFANTLRADFKGDPYQLYLKYREINPSPYLFFFDFGDEQLVGASPEMMVRVEKGEVHLRPISGTAKRGHDPIEDHDNMLALLQDPKERAELDMLIDLGRNDLSRVCQPGIEISDYRFVEKYSRVMHTVAHLKGKLRVGYTAFDALIACLNAGTLTGAPKVAAMQIIENHETERRGYYGGSIGYLNFSGEMDTGIIIRTAHIKDGKLDLKAGATLLFDSDPEKEYFETINKAKAFLDTIGLDKYDN